MVSCLSGNIDIVKMLINHGANLNYQNNDQNTVFIYACRARNLNLVKSFLMQNNIDISIQNKYNQTGYYFLDE